MTEKNLKVLCVSTGRSGTKTMRAMLEKILRLNSDPGIVRQETKNALIWEGAIDYVCNNDDKRLLEVLDTWTHSVETGCGYAFCLPVFQKVYGSDLKIIHLKRDQEAYVSSALRRPEVNPQNWGGYVPNNKVEIARVTAVHMNEMSDTQWQVLPLADKLKWHHETTHRLVEEHSGLFKNTLYIETEQLNDPETPEKLAKFIDPSWSCEGIENPWLGLDRFFAQAGFSGEQQLALEFFFGPFDWKRATGDTFYIFEHFLERLEHLWRRASAGDGIGRVSCPPYEAYPPKLKEYRDALDQMLATQKAREQGH